MRKLSVETKPSLPEGPADEHPLADPPRRGDTTAVDGADPAEVKSLSSVRSKKTLPKPEVAVQIGRQLRTMYDDVLAQPVPDRFLDLLNELDTRPEPAGKEKK